MSPLATSFEATTLGFFFVAEEPLKIDHLLRVGLGFVCGSSDEVPGSGAAPVDAIGPPATSTMALPSKQSNGNSPKSVNHK
jgi:hypothetical protein